MLSFILLVFIVSGFGYFVQTAEDYSDYWKIEDPKRNLPR